MSIRPGTSSIRTSRRFRRCQAGSPSRYEAGVWFVEAEEVAAARQDHVNSDLGEVETPGYGVTNLRAGITRGPFSVVLGIDNVFDRLYRESLSYARDPFRSGTLVMEPGRSLGLSALLRY